MDGTGQVHNSFRPSERTMPDVVVDLLERVRSYMILSESAERVDMVESIRPPPSKGEPSAYHAKTEL